MGDLEKNIQDIARELLEDGKVDLVIGYEKGTTPLRSTPFFVKEVSDVQKLIWDPTCEVNLTKYLLDRDERIGIVAKGCDSRSIVVCIAERQIDRNKVAIIGVPCRGVINRKKIEAELDGQKIVEATVNDEEINVSGEGFEKILPTKNYLCNSCLSCRHRNPVIYDFLVGAKVPEAEDINDFAEIEELESKPSEERWNYFAEELGSCIRCYACRSVCPMCYCKECFVDETMPQWFGKTSDLSDTMIFHIVRAFHLAGRCVDCGACSRACPMEINLRALKKKVEKMVKERFDYEAGTDLEEAPVLGTFKQDDSQEFIIK